MFPQHLQITDKRTCWHGNAGGRLNADPQNVVSTVPSFSLETFFLGPILSTLNRAHGN